MDILTSIGLAVPAGLNAYIPLLAVALAGRLGWMDLAPPFDLLGEWWAILLIAVLLVVELLADKVPAVDTANDAIQTVVRPAAGGIVFAAGSSAVFDTSPVLLLAAGIVLAGGVHAVKSTARPAINTVTAGTGGPAVSVVEDIYAAVMSFFAITLPLIAVGLGVLLIALFVRAIRRWRRPTPAAS
jgi:uncharacterized membrane protein